MRQLITFLCLLSFVIVTNAEEVELSYDSGNTSAYWNGGDRGNAEAVCFSPMHPCTLKSFRFYPRGTGEMEWHVWEVDGARGADMERDLIDPIMIDVEDDGDWITVDISDEGLVLNPPRNFQIGYVKQDPNPQLWIDGERTVEERTHVYARSNFGWTWMLFGGNGGNYLVRATVEYFDEIEEEDFTFHLLDSEEIGLGGLGNHAWGDYDNDGWEDLLVGGKRLYKNLGDGTFEYVSEDAGILEDNPAGTGTWGDFNNDGWLDFFAGNSQDNVQDRLYRNNSDGTFSFANDDYFFEHGDNPTAGCGWGDANNDGFLELYIVNSEHWNDGNPEYFRDFFFFYDTDFDMFLDITPRDLYRNQYYGRSVAWCDFDFDNDMDVYISNYRLQPNFLLVNIGFGDDGYPEFEDEAAERGVKGYLNRGAYGHTIGSTWGDYDNDGDFDLLVGNFAHLWGIDYQDKIMLCENSGAPDYEFEDIFAQSGIQYTETVYCPQWGDYDNDGYIDLFVSTVYGGRQPFMYHNNDGDGTFDISTYECGLFGRAYNSNSVTWCDYDHDGDLDLFVASGDGGLYQNRTNDNDETNWFELVLQGSDDNNHFAFGSRASVHAGDMNLLRQVEGGASAQGAQNMTALHYGLADNEMIDSLIVVWLGGETERFYEIEPNQRLTAVEGQGLLTAPPQSGSIAAPLDFHLSSLYPNPFNSSVTIKFHMSHRDRVKIVAFDLTGRMVGMISEREFSSGSHELTWNADHLPSGDYLIQATHEFGIASKIVTLLK